jgi:hypothetical protein
MLAKNLGHEFLAEDVTRVWGWKASGSRQRLNKPAGHGVRFWDDRVAQPVKLGVLDR